MEFSIFRGVILRFTTQIMFIIFMPNIRAPDRKRIIFQLTCVELFFARKFLERNRVGNFEGRNLIFPI